MATNCNKRKAEGLTESSTGMDRSIVTAIEELAKRVETLEDRVRELTKKAGERNESMQHDVEEILSSDDESVVDKSDTWTIMFRQLREYRIIHGDCKVPNKYPQNKKLGTWVNNQKAFYNNCRTGTGLQLKPERIVKLESIGFSWGKKYPSPASWDEMFDQLQTFQQRMGNCNVPFNAADPTPLAKWIAFQRKEYKLFKKGYGSILTLDQIGKLNNLGMSWKGPKLKTRST